MAKSQADVGPLLATLTERLDNTRKELETVRDSQEGFKKDLTEYDKRLALLAQQFDELKRQGEEWGKRRWGLMQGFLIAVAGSALTLLVQYLLSHAKKP